MRARIVVAALLVAAVAAAASTAAGAASSASAAKSITVWLQTDAQADNWKPIVAAANAQFQAANPGVSVNVQYQTWGTHLQKFDATLAGGTAPDVIEMGNTEMTKYMAAGAFQDISSDKASLPNSDSWLQGLALWRRLQRAAAWRERSSPRDRRDSFASRQAPDHSARPCRP